MPETRTNPFTALGYDPEKCQQRRRLAALRDGVDAAPVRLMREAPADPPELLSVAGILPETHEDELAAINGLLPGNSEPLTAEDVYVHYLEAASGRLIEDRWLFLTERTLKNIANEAAQGFAFMNSHRTGGISAPSELPFGKTFAGRFERYMDGDGREQMRSVLGMYMLRGVHPNGPSGPSTDDLDRMIRGGTVFDVSMGLSGGERLCDICGHALNAYDREKDEYRCRHVPGSDHKLSEEQREAQTARGVPGGVATYSLDDAHANECSAVYDGAVPGAGFAKALALARRGELSTAELLQAQGAYRTLLSKGDFEPHSHERSVIHDGPDPTGTTRAPGQVPAPRKEKRRMSLLEDIKALLGRAKPEELAELAAEGTDDSVVATLAGTGGGGSAREANGLRGQEEKPPAAAAAVQPPHREQSASAALAAEVAALRKQIADQEAYRQQENARRVEGEAVRFADDLVREGKALTPEKPALIALYQRAAFDDQELPAKLVFGADIEGRPKEGTRVQTLHALFTTRPPHALFHEIADAKLLDGMQILGNRATSGPEEKLSPEAHERYLAMTETGRQIIRERQQNGKGS